MPESGLRFLHSAEFHLESPLRSGEEPPAHLRDLFLDAPYQAAARVFDIAIEEQVAFVVLAGDIVDPWLSGPRGPLFLLEQFERLRANGIDVYWSLGAGDSPESWSAGFQLPPNVTLFVPGPAKTVLCERDGHPIARIVGQGRDGGTRLNLADFRVEQSGIFTVGVAQGVFEPDQFEVPDVDYWALGGRHVRDSLRVAKGVAHYCGSPQGRGPDEPGAHGCTLVQVDADGRPRTSHRVTDAIRYRLERVQPSNGADKAALDALIVQQVRAMQADAPGVDQLVCWSLAGRGGAVEALRREATARDFLELLRSKYGQHSPRLWSVSLTVESPEATAHPDAERETILGDFLRTMDGWRTQADKPMDFTKYLFGQHEDPAFAPLAGMHDDARGRLLEQATALGVELLTAEGARP